MRIGIDIDDTLTDTKTAFIQILKKYGFSEDIYFRNFFDREKQRFLYSHHDEIMEITKLKEDAKEVLDKLKKNNNYLIIITARNYNYGKKAVECGKKIIVENNLLIDEIYFDKAEKSEICKDLNIDIMIDDNEEVIRSVEKIGIEGLLFGKKVKTWKEVLEYISEKEG